MKVKDFSVISVCALVVFISTVLLFTLVGLELTLLKEDFYYNIIKEEEVIEVVKPRVQSLVTEALEEKGLDEDYTNIVVSIIDEEKIEFEMRNMLDQIFEEEVPNITIDLSAYDEEIRHELLVYVNDNFEPHEVDFVYEILLDEVNEYLQPIEIELPEEQLIYETRGFIKDSALVLYIGLIFFIVLFSIILIVFVETKKALKALSIIYALTSAAYFLFIDFVKTELVQKYVTNNQLPIGLIEISDFYLNKFLRIPLSLIVISLGIFALSNYYETIFKD